MSRLYGEPFAVIPEWLLDADVSDRAVRLFGFLNRHANRDGKAHPGRRRLAERMRCSPSTLDRALDELIAAKAVAVEPQFRTDGGRSSNTYWLWPATFEVVTGDDSPSHGGGGPLVTGAEGPSSPVTTLEEREPVEREPVERDKPGAAADEVLRRVWDERKARGAAVPANFIAARGVVTKLLAAGWDADALVEACDQAPTISVGAVELWLNRQRPDRRRPGPSASRRDLAAGVVTDL